MTSDQILAAARACLGTPFKHQGRLNGRALDCAGLIVHVAADLGLTYLDQTGYARLPGGGLLEAALDAQPCLARVETMQPGDIVLMSFSSGPQHLGFFGGENLIHAYQPYGKVCEHRMTDEWRQRVCRVYRFVGVDHG